MITLQPLTTSDLDLLVQWMNQPHVKTWWPDNLTDQEIRTKYGNRIGSTAIVPLIISVDEKPIGFLQYYDVTQAPDDWNKDEPAGTIGFDIYIGEKEYLGKGYGTAAISLMIKQLFTNPNIAKIIVDVDPKNQAAIRAYEKAGLRFVRTAQTAEGFIHVMELRKTCQRN
jgi:RimJ/RimL family protein N-acetyltransferase